MLIDQFNRFLQEVSIWPSSFWAHNFYAARKSFVLQLDEITYSFKEKNTKAFRNLETLTALFLLDLDELKLAKAIKNVADDFENSGKKDKKIELFSQLSDNFLKRVQLFEKYGKQRSKLKLDEKKKQDFDKRLFEKEGTFYCLEYYLAAYKKMVDLKKDSEKKQFFEAKEIDLGFGNLPGLKEDFGKDEVLQKFILPILDDIIRDHLITSYYSCKRAVVENYSINEFEKSFKKFIYYLLLAFQENKIEKLSSKFFKPYGDQPAVDYLISVFQDYD